MDLYARRIVGWALSNRPGSQLTTRALRVAFESRGCPQQLMFHSDQGSLLHLHRVSPNAVALPDQTEHESPWQLLGYRTDGAFFRRLKTEWMPERGYTSQGQAEADVQRYLTCYYNHQRPRSYNGYKTPVDAESVAGQT